MTPILAAEGVAPRASGTRRSSACSSWSPRSCSSAARSTCCSAPTSAPGSGSSSRSPASRGSWCCSRSLWLHHRVAAQHAEGPDPAVEGASRSSPSPDKAKIDRRPRHRHEDERRRRHRGRQREGRGRRRARHQGVDADGRVHAQRQPLRQVRRRHQVPGARRPTRSAAAARSSGRAEFTHTRRSTRSSQFCEVDDGRADRSALPPLPPECSTATDAATGYVVLERDLGSLRVPAVRGVLHLARSSSASACSRCTGGSRTRWQPRPAKAESRGGARHGRLRTGEGVTMLRRIRARRRARPRASSARCSRSAAPAGAQQLVDAGKEGDGSGGLAFVLMVGDGRRSSAARCSSWTTCAATVCRRTTTRLSRPRRHATAGARAQRASATRGGRRRRAATRRRRAARCSVVGVREAHEEGLVAARRRGRCRASSMPWKKRAYARVVGGLRSLVVGDRRGRRRTGR